MKKQDNSEDFQSLPLDHLIAKSQENQSAENSDTPHPLIVAERWGFNLPSHVTQGHIKK
jgi:hypothetical protein